MKEYILSSIFNSPLSNRKREAFLQEVKIYRDYLFDEDDISEFIEFLDAKCTRLNSLYTRTKKFTLTYHNGTDESFWISVKTDTYDECAAFMFVFTRIAGRWNLANKEDAR